MIARTYDITQEFIATCQLLGQSPRDILHKSGLAADVLKTGLVVTAKQMHVLFEALVTGYGQDDWTIKLANGFSDGAFCRAFLAMQCSATIREGIYRTTRFKELMQPVKWTVMETESMMTLQLRSHSADFPLEGMAQVMNFLWLVQTIRKVTAKNIVPAQVFLTGSVPQQAQIERQLGCVAETGCVAQLSLPIHVVDMPVLLLDQRVSNGFDADAALIDAVSNADTHFVNVVRLQILDLLPSGAASSKRIAERMGLSKRTLERRLSKEGLSFTDVLRVIRQQTADHYLRNTCISIEDVSRLIGYREVNSFYRACKAWYGASPEEIRHTSAAMVKQPQSRKRRRYDADSHKPRMIRQRQSDGCKRKGNVFR